MKLLITGASGFIGGVLAVRAGSMPDVHAVLIARQKIPHTGDTSLVLIDRIETFTGWDQLLAGVDIVIHAAAQAHVAVHSDSHAATDEPNAQSTKVLAETAARQGVRHFIYLSSAGVNGNVSRGRAVEETDPVQPHSSYARSKYAGEQILKDVCSRSSMGFTCLRMPLVYGRKARGTFAQLLRFVQTVPTTPFGAASNQRSLLCVDNLADFLLEFAIHAAPLNDTFFIADEGVLSTRGIVDWIAEGAGKRIGHLPVPPFLMKAVLYAVGKGSMYQQLFGDFYLNTGKLERATAWRPRVDSAEALRNIGRSLNVQQDS